MNEQRRGRVRSEAAREAILAATTQLFHERGYDHLTIEGIAKAAGVAKQTIYRWWPSRGALIADCLIEGRLFPIDVTVPDSGDLETDILAWLATVLSILDTPNGGALLRSLVAAAAEDEAVGDRLSASFGVDRFLADRLAQAVRDGQLAPDTPVDQLGQALLGVIIVQTLGRQPSPATELIRLVHFVLAAGTASHPREHGGDQ